MKKLYEEQTRSICEIAKELNIPQDRLYRYIRKEQKVENMTVQLLYSLSKAEKISMDELYQKIKTYLNTF